MFRVGDYVYLHTNYNKVYQVDCILFRQSSSNLYLLYRIDMRTGVSLKGLQKSDIKDIKLVSFSDMELAIDYIRDKKIKCLI